MDEESIDSAERQHDTTKKNKSRPTFHLIK